jgi:hypothetical protein
MKYKQELHNYFDALGIESPASAKRQAEARRALLQVQPVKQTFVTRLRSTLLVNGVQYMSKNKYVKPAGFAVVAVVAIFAVTAVAISNSPGVRAESLADKGISSLQKLDAGKLNTLTAQFSSDPIAALKEAKNAKDLKIISKAEYEQLKSSSRSVETNSRVTELPGGGYEMSGSVSGDITPGGAGFSSGSGPAGPSADVPAGTYKDGVPVASSDAVNSGGSSSSSQNNAPKAVQDRANELRDELTQNQTRAAKFVSFTNASGQTVVIAFDNNDSPLFKAVFVK